MIEKFQPRMACVLVWLELKSVCKILSLTVVLNKSMNKRKVPYLNFSGARMLAVELGKSGMETEEGEQPMSIAYPAGLPTPLDYFFPHRYQYRKILNSM